MKNKYWIGFSILWILVCIFLIWKLQLYEEIDLPYSWEPCPKGEIFYDNISMNWTWYEICNCSWCLKQRDG